MDFRSLRTRLALWYAAIFLAGFLLLSGWMWFVVRQYFTAQADARLAQRVQGIHWAVEGESTEPLNALRDELREFGLQSAEGDLVSIRGRGGRELLEPTGLSESALANASDHADDLFAGGRHYRAQKGAFDYNGENYAFALATSMTESDQFLGRFRALLFGAVPLLLVIASAGGYWMSRRALAPVDELTNAARRISLENLSQRLPVRQTGDELERLGTTWNQMLDRLETAIARMQQFTADASHELRTPISIIRTTAELALRRDREMAGYREALESIHRESEWMTQLAGDLLSLARFDAGTHALRAELVGLDELCRAVCRDAGMVSEAKGVGLQSHAPAALQVRGDDGSLRRLLAILLDNAIRHTPSGGTVTVEATATINGVALEVRDTGEGIRDQDLPHIFERFYRGDAARTHPGGSGLGLAIASSIARAHGAEIVVERSQPHGATFRVHFPSLPAKRT